MIERECKQCGKAMTFRTLTDTRTFCSRRCMLEYRSAHYEQEDDSHVVMPPLVELTDEAAKNLSAAILNQIVEEYQHQLRKLKKHPHDKGAIARIFDLRDEILSSHFSIISLGMDGEAMIRMIEEDFNRKWEEKQREAQKKADPDESEAETDV